MSNKKSLHFGNLFYFSHNQTRIALNSLAFSVLEFCHQLHMLCLAFGQTAAKVLEGAHQQHGFLSITYTQAVTKNVRHKLTTRTERPTRSSAAGQRATADPLADGSPHYLREILLTAQPFDVVLSCPLLATVAGIFQVGKTHLSVLITAECRRRICEEKWTTKQMVPYCKARIGSVLFCTSQLTCVCIIYTNLWSN